MTCPRCTLSLCICDVAAARPPFAAATIVVIGVAVYLAAFLYALLPGGPP